MVISEVFVETIFFCWEEYNCWEAYRIGCMLFMSIVGQIQMSLLGFDIWIWL